VFLRAKSKGATVQLVLPAKGYEFTLSVNLSDEVYARLLRDEFNRRIENALKDAREKSYNAGWRQAKAKEARSDWFSGYLELSE
jgi:hypothetical protein